MTAFQIKFLAIAFMVIDHVGLFFLPDFPILRAIGRMAFPLFAWLIANGAYHTHDIKAYAQRLFLFAFISQAPFYLANRQIDPSFYGLNVFFTLFLGILAIIGIKKGNKAISLLIILLCALLASMLQTDYGYVGVLSIVLFYIFFKNKKYLIISQIILAAISSVLSMYGSSFIDPVGLIALIFIWFYNNRRGLGMKYVFYIFYPLQYLIIFWVLTFFKAQS